MAHEILTLKSVHQTEKYGYSHVAKNGNTLYISGQVARDHGVDCVGRGDIEAQTRQVLTNLQNILEEVGGSLRNVAKLTTILTHHSYRETFRKVRPEFFQEPAPANTLICCGKFGVTRFFNRDRSDCRIRLISLIKHRRKDSTLAAVRSWIAANLSDLTPTPYLKVVS